VVVPITPPTVTANNVTVAAIAYNTSATTINLNAPPSTSTITVSGVGSLPAGTLALSGQVGAGTTSATGATTLTYTATGTTYASPVTVNYVASGPCATNSGAPRTITIPINLPPAPTAADLGPVTVPAVNGTATAIDVTGAIAGFRSPSPLSIVAQPPAGQGTVTVTGPAQFTYNASGFAGSTTFTYRVAGPTGTALASNTATVTINATAAPITTGTSVTTAFNTPIVVDLAPFIVGAVTAVTPSAAVGGTAVATGATTIRFTPNAGFRGAGSFNYTATGSGGTSASASTVNVTVNPPPPVVTSAAAASGTTGVLFSYQITASNAPTSFAVTGTLPAGLGADANGLISGIPTQTGTFRSPSPPRMPAARARRQ
jgi:hypothetical protein